MDALMQWGTDIVVALQAFPGLTGLMEFFTFLGTEEFFLLLMPALYWCIDAGLGLRLAVALTASGSLNELLKLAFHLPRPYWVDSRVQALGTEPSYGLPSGHAMNAVSVWGFIATQLKKNWAWAAALALILLISLSRLYLGVHFPTDVLGGWVFGAGLLWAFLRWEQNARAWLGRLTLLQQIGLAFVVSLVYLALAAGILTAMTGMPDPPEWEQTAQATSPVEADEAAIAPRNPESPVSSAGILFGLGAALALVSRSARFDAKGPWRKRAVRFVVGLIGVLIVWRGLALVFPDGLSLLALVFRYIRYALTLVWALYLAPWVFLRTRLAEAQPFK